MDLRRRGFSPAKIEFFASKPYDTPQPGTTEYVARLEKLAHHRAEE
jgi:hypothetical protein